jgi:hypothetical protein
LATKLDNPVDVKMLLPRSNAPKVSVKRPEHVWSAPKTRFNVALLSVAAAQTDPLAVVQVPEPELASKKTASALVGAEAPDAPPVVADQLAVLEASQVPVPPTQNLLAMIK